LNFFFLKLTETIFFTWTKMDVEKYSLIDSMRIELICDT